MMHVVVYESLDELPSSCDPLFNEAGKSSFFMTPHWYRNLVQQALPPEIRVRVYVAYEGADVRGILPMTFIPGRWSWRKGRQLDALANYYSSLFMPVIAADDRGVSLLALVEAIAGERWDSVDLHPMAVNSSVFSDLAAILTRSGMLAQPYFCFGNWYLEVGGRSYQEYFNTLPSKLKNTLNRKGRQLACMGQSRIEIFTGTDTVDRAITAYEKVYSLSWKIQEPHPGFMPGLIRLCAENGWLRLGVIYIENAPVAVQLWIVKDGIAAIYKLAYDERISKLSAGSILTARLMEYVMDVDRVREVDYLTGDDEYKKDWMSHRRERWGMVAYNMRTPRGIYMGALKQVADFAKSLISNQSQVVTNGHLR